MAECKPPPLNLLLVEDDPDHALLFEAALSRLNLACRVVVLRDGEEAIAFLSGDGLYADRGRHPLPNLILLDLKMPRKSGHDVLEWIRGREHFRKTPVVMMSCSNDPRDVGRSYELGANSYVVKPPGFGQLQDMIRSIVAYWIQHNRSPET